MNLFKLFKITDWYGNEHIFTPKKLYKRICEDSKSNYNWIASVTELVKVCQNPDFPIEYGYPIMMQILNCFANIEISDDHGDHREITSSEQEAINYCYNALYNISYKANNARNRYLKAVIQSVSRWYLNGFELNQLGYGRAYSMLRDQWELSKFHELGSKPSLDFTQVKKDLQVDYHKTVKDAAAEGVFKNDSRINAVAMEFQKYWAGLDFLDG